MNKKINVWGRNFDLKVIFDVYEGEGILDNQKASLDEFVKKSGDILSSFYEIERYCIEKDGSLIGDSIRNIFKYVMPESLFVKRDEKKRIVVLLCNYRFDEEHGIALFFENEKLANIGTQNEI